MTKAKLEGLQRLADLVLDQQLLTLRTAQAQREATRTKIAALDHSGDWGTSSLQSNARAEVLYQAWADARRRDLNLLLARQTVAVMTAEDASRTAFGRKTALRAIQTRK